MTRVLIKGAGEHSSGTAHRLFRCGFAVAMTEIAQPTAVRLEVALRAAVYRGSITVEGVEGRLHELSSSSELDALTREQVPVFVDPDGSLRDLWRPDVIIDGRIMKRNLDNHLSDAPLVIGYGPGLVTGRDVHYVVEPHRGHNLGRIIARGEASPDTGVPGSIGGETQHRVLRAPTAGPFVGERAIGDRVAPGDLVGRVGQQPVLAELQGIIRGLVHSPSAVVAHQKLGDIDPRGERTFCHTISEKARCLSGSALEIILANGWRPRGSP